MREFLRQQNALSRQIRSWILTALVLVLPSIAAAVPVTFHYHAPDATTVNALGQLCDGAHPCPLGNTCLTIANTGSQEQGFCTPACNGVNDVCWAGYARPATGAPTCEGPICTIHCRVDEDCPAPLGCRPDTESFGWFCVVP